MWKRIVLSLIGAATAPAAPVEAVASLDLERYAGKWYEISRLPNRFQRDCASNVMAEYTLRSDGKVTVLNQCRTAEGKTKTARGTAKPANQSGPKSKLKVTFFWPFYGDYWVLALDPEYEWALVGEPSRKYLWILSRKPEMNDSLVRDILERARSQGYDVGPMIRTRQSH